MRYALLINIDEKNDPPEMMDQARTAAYMAFGEEVQKAGIHRAGERLRPSTTATTVRVREGKTLTTDGPFAETREQLGGFYILDCKDLDEAIAYAAKLPGSWHGSVEVRPIWEMGE